MTALGLYLHVPFCRCKCDWCAFVSEEGADAAELWLTRIVGQLEHPPSADAVWQTVYLGGGTPSLLTPDQLKRLLEAVSSRRSPGAELTFEANPESLSADHLVVLREGGGTRLSLGIQTFNEDLLARHNRPTRRVHLEAAQRLLSSWTGQLSLDLICGLAGQSEDGQRRDVEEALAWHPDHLSFYSLTLEPGTPLARRVSRRSATLPSDDDTARWWLEGRDRLEAAGYASYEVSNFALPGRESRHNGRYWALEPWWGLGPSAASFLPHGAQNFEYRTETSSLSRWLAGAKPRIEVPTALELAKDRLLSGLRRTAGVPLLPWVDWLPQTLAVWKGRIVLQGDRLFLSREAFPFLDAFLRAAFAELDGRPEFR